MSPPRRLPLLRCDDADDFLERLERDDLLERLERDDLLERLDRDDLRVFDLVGGERERDLDRDRKLAFEPAEDERDAERRLVGRTAREHQACK